MEDQRTWTRVGCLMAAGLAGALMSAATARDTAGAPPRPALAERTEDSPALGAVHVHPEDEATDLLAAADEPGWVADVELVGVQAATPAGMRVPETTYTFRLVEQFRGPALAGIFTLTEVGGMNPDGSAAFTCRSHRMELGGRYVIYVRPDAERVKLPFRRVLQVLDGGATLADEAGRVAGAMGHALVFTPGDGVRTLRYLNAPHTGTTAVGVQGPPEQSSTPLPAQPTASVGVPTPLRGDEFLALLRAPGVAPSAAAPAGLASIPSPFEPRYNYCGWVNGPNNYRLLMPNDTQYNWFLGAAADWNDLVNPGWMVGTFYNNGNVIRDAAIGAGNGQNNCGHPSSTQLTNGGYTNWPGLGNPNGICFTWTVAGGCTRISEADVFVNPVNDGDEAQWRKSMVHELGHAFALGHEDRTVAIMVSGTWRVPPNYSSYRYNRLDDLNGVRSVIDFANSQSAGTFTKANWSDIATVSQAHPNWGASADVRYNTTSLSSGSVIQGNTVNLNHMYVESRGLVSPGATTIKVYLSTNTTISTADYEVYSGSWANFGAANVWNDGTLGLSVSNAVPPGVYYVGWILTPTTADLDSSNNTGLLRGNSDDGYAPRTLTVISNAPGNDNCGSAYGVLSGWVMNFNTTNANVDGSATCGNSNSTPDVWYSFFAPSDGFLTLDTCGSSYDTVVSVHSGCPGTTLNQIDCNDDRPSNQPCSSIRASYLRVPLHGGTTAKIRISGYNGVKGTGTLAVNFQPGSLCPADFDGSGIVDDTDFVIFAMAYNDYFCDADCPEDLTGDGIVDDTDFVIFAQAYNLYFCP